MEENTPPAPETEATASTLSKEDETWEEAAKRRKKEKQEKVTIIIVHFYLFVIIIPLQLRIAAGRQNDESVEALVDSYIYSEIQDTECLR